MAVAASKTVTMEVIPGMQSFTTTINATANETDYSSAYKSGMLEMSLILPVLINKLYLPLEIR